MRPNGRPRNDRLRAMRFALWAQHQPTAGITPQMISGLFGISLESARLWRTDWLAAASPLEIENVPAVLNVRAGGNRRDPNQGNTP
ncbi:hypothetical protein [Stenotrophomonas sp. MMGLT7]|uniref:hypothetical protein n=1 Tax=Stenotrophomonas sp. MMGLT7 TaxID=2901227 RepID=UPI001E58AA4E|nr:hypothetical protein [Stenotrophomonas sp. MMGLT7]MCD7099080.1 hypothetical protein [Stenotrophomonas sp. MMGLT7]